MLLMLSIAPLTWIMAVPLDSVSATVAVPLQVVPLYPVCTTGMDVPPDGVNVTEGTAESRSPLLPALNCIVTDTSPP